jgi:N-acetylglucosaminyl-diphospho-decaprenol L-rhamnosyltransferase
MAPSPPRARSQDQDQARYQARIDVVVVNWNSRSLLRDCVAALDRSTIAGRLHLVVVDNASTDASADGLTAQRIGIDVFRNPQNRGFAAACNQGAATGRAPYLLFLNPDANVRPDTLERTLAFLEDPHNAGVAIAGAQLVDADGRIRRTCARRPTAAALLLRAMFLDRLVPRLVKPHFMVEWDHRDTREVDQVPGAFLMIRRAMFERLGGFDERFFLYYEDLDLCARAHDAGSAVVYFVGAVAEHIGGGTTQAIIGRRAFYLARSEVAYAAKHHGRLAACALAVLTFGVALPARLLHAAVGRKHRH